MIVQNLVSLITNSRYPQETFTSPLNCLWLSFIIL